MKDQSRHRFQLSSPFLNINYVNRPWRVTSAYMIFRRLHKKLDTLLDKNPVVVLIGSRSAGKTTLSHEVVATRDAINLDLQSPRDLAKLNDIEHFCMANDDKMLILDEVQRVPGLFASLRSIINVRRRQGRKTAQFLLLGAASLELIKQPREQGHILISD